MSGAEVATGASVLNAGASAYSASQSGGSSKKSSGYSWTEMHPFQNDVYQSIYDLYNQANVATPYYSGYVGPSDATQQGWNMAGQATGNYQNAATGYGNAGFQQGLASNAASNAYGSFQNAMGTQGNAGQQYWNAAGQYGQGANAFGGAIPGQYGTLGTAGGNYDFLSNAAQNVANNPAVQAQLQANQQSVTDTLQNSWLPSINNNALQVNAMGSSRQGLAQGQAIGDAAKALASSNASTLGNAYNSGLAAQQSALGYTDNMLQNQLAPAQTQMLQGDAYSQAGSAIGNAAASQAQAGQYGLQGAGALNTAGQYAAQGAGYQGNAGDALANASNAMMATGASQEGYTQAQLDDSNAAALWPYQEAWNRLSNLNNVATSLSPLGVGASWGNATASTPGANVATSAVGGAMQGWSAGTDIYDYGVKKGWWGGSGSGSSKNIYADGFANGTGNGSQFLW